MNDKTWQPQEGGAFDFGKGGSKLSSPTDAGLGNKLNSILSGEAAQRMSDFSREFQALQSKLQGAGGLEADFAKNMGILNEAFILGALAVEDYAKLMDLLFKQQPFYVKGLEREMKAEKLLEEQRQQEQQDREDLLKLGDQRIHQLRDDNEMIRFETDLLGTSRVERELALNAMQKEIALRGVTNDYQRDAIDGLYKERAALIVVRDAREQAFGNGVGFWSDMARGVGDVARALTGGVGNALDVLKNKARDFVGELLSLSGQKLVLNIGALVTTGSVSNALANQATSTGQGTGAGSVLSWAGNASGLYGTAGGLYAGFASATSEAALGASFVGPSATLAGGSVGVGAQLGTYMSGLDRRDPRVWIAMAVIAIARGFSGNTRAARRWAARSWGSSTRAASSWATWRCPVRTTIASTRRARDEPRRAAREGHRHQLCRRARAVRRDVRQLQVRPGLRSRSRRHRAKPRVVHGARLSGKLIYRAQDRRWTTRRCRRRCCSRASAWCSRPCRPPSSRPRSRRSSRPSTPRALRASRSMRSSSSPTRSRRSRTTSSI
jgi:hypothetical protein